MLRLIAAAFSVSTLTFKCDPRATEKGVCDLRKQRQLMKWAERLVLPEQLSTNSASCLWTKCRCNRQDEIAGFPFDSGKSVTTWGRFPKCRNLKQLSCARAIFPLPLQTHCHVSLSSPRPGRLIVGTIQWVSHCP